jgi:hypothetical protein
MPPRRHIDIAEEDFLRGRDNGLGARATDSIDRHCRRGHRQSSTDAGLARRIHFLTGLHDIAHDHGFDFVLTQSGTRDGATDRYGSERRRRHILEAAAESADRCPDRLGKDD